MDEKIQKVLEEKIHESTSRINEITSLVNSFWELPSHQTMFALSPPNYSEVNQDKIFMVQLPKPEKAVEALDIIKNALIKKSN